MEHSRREGGLCGWIEDRENTNVVVEAFVRVPELIEVLERVVRREVLELDEQIGKDFFHCCHELCHEFVHLHTKRNVIRIVSI